VKDSTLDVRGLAKSYGSRRAVEDLHFSIVEGIRKADSVSVSVCGFDAFSRRAKARALPGLAMAIGVALPEQRADMLVAQLVFLMMPADLIPEGLSYLSRIFPARWAMEAMRAMGSAGGAPNEAAWIAGAVLAAAGGQA